MSPIKFLSVFFISSALLLIGKPERIKLRRTLTQSVSLFVAHGRPLEEFSSEDDRMNEISAEFIRKRIMSDVDRIFSSAEIQKSKGTNKIKRNNAETTKSSKHAHGMITSMLSFVSNVFNFGKTMIRNE